ncbi:MAG: hypothetical protein SH868_19460, partial [Bythopirellula sp.]|nr:hypothetical protein [Bythopirellula sp.]
MPSIKFPQLVALAELLESEDVFLSLGTLESLLEQCQEQLKLRAKEFAPAWSTNLEWNLEQLETTFRIYLLEKAGNGQFRTCAIAFSKNLRLALFQPDEFMELKGPEAKDHRNQLMATLRERSRKWPQPPKYIKLVSLPADASENNPSSVTNFLQQLIDAPDVVELTEPGMALLEAHLKRPRTLKQMRQEALAADGSNKTTGRQKLKLIRDYNRRLPRRAEASEPAQNWNICQGYLDPLANALAAIAHRFTKHFDVARHDELEREYESIVGASAHFSEHLTDDQRQRLDTVVQELAAINEPPTAQQVESLYK